MPNTLGQVDPAHPRGYPTVGRAIDGPQRAIFAVFRSKPFCSRGSGEWRTVAYCTVSLAAICKQAVVGKIGKLSISNNDKYIPKMVTGHSWLCDAATNELYGTPQPNHRRGLLNMPPMSFLGVVTKAGFMNKTATVTVSRWVIDKRTGKVCDDDQTSNTASTSPQIWPF